MPGRIGSVALLGREQEQAELYDALMLALKGRLRSSVVAGDAGVGKTTLVADLARRAEELGFTVGGGSLSRHRGRHLVRAGGRGGPAHSSRGRGPRVTSDSHGGCAGSARPDDAAERRARATCSTTCG